VLVVEDAIRNRKMLCRLLANGGYLVTQAENGQIGFDLVSKNPGEYDMILMDFEMPVMDGPAATKAIRAIDYKGPIIGITGNVLETDRKLFIAAGANEVLFKPLTLRAFMNCVDELGRLKSESKEDGENLFREMEK
jgi:CheY-like chemotaxis protein